MTAHVAGVPVEELLPFAGAAAAGLAFARVRLAVHLRRDGERSGDA